MLRKLLVAVFCAKPLLTAGTEAKAGSKWLPGSPFEGMGMPMQFTQPSIASQTPAMQTNAGLSMVSAAPMSSASTFSSQIWPQPLQIEQPQAFASQSFLQQQTAPLQPPQQQLQQLVQLQQPLQQPQAQLSLQQSFLAPSQQTSQLPAVLDLALIQSNYDLAASDVQLHSLQQTVAGLQQQLKAERDNEQRIADEATKAVAAEKAGLQGVAQAVAKVTDLARVRAAQSQQQLDHAVAGLDEAKRSQAAAEQRAHIAEQQYLQLNGAAADLIERNATLQAEVIGPLESRVGAAEQMLALEQQGKAALEEELKTVQQQLQQALSSADQIALEKKRQELQQQTQQELTKLKADTDAEIQKLRTEAESETSRARQLAQQAVLETRQQFQNEVARAQASEKQARSAALLAKQEAAQQVSLAQQQVATQVQTARDSVARVERLMQGWAEPAADGLGSSSATQTPGIPVGSVGQSDLASLLATPTVSMPTK